jgi:hypothetical protein
MPNKVSLVLAGELPPSRLRGPGTVRVAPDRGAVEHRGELRVHPLPVVLAGPILRYVSTAVVRVWVAMSAPCGVRLNVRRHDDAEGRLAATSWGAASGMVSSPPGDLTAPQNDLLRVGVDLYVCVVEARGTLQEGLLYEYDLEFVAPEGMSFDNANGVVRRRFIAYAGADFPTFYINSRSNFHVTFMHASCRKMHGPGTDATERADRHLRENVTNLGRRPAFVLYTGDQIYGDDVDVTLGGVASAVGERLIGFSEIMAEPGEGAPLAGRVPSELTPQQRQDVLLDRSTGFTFERSISPHHLMTLGEYVAMHLLVWSPTLWEEHVLRRERPIAGASGFHGSHRAAIEAASRVLANAPSYMMMDDHEVTDDFPMYQSQWNTIVHSRLGRWVVANARAAVWACQLKGSGGSNLGAVVESNLRGYLAAGQAYGTRSTAEADRFREQREALRQARDAYSWNIATFAGGCGYVTPTFPPVIVLDTRTQRALSADFPGLLNAQGLSWLRQRIGEVRRRAPRVPLLLVSPVPVLGPWFFDAYQRREGAGTYAEDPEGWPLHAATFVSFMDLLSAEGHLNAVVLSGDIHVGLAGYGDWSQLGSDRTIRVIQLISSALRNHPVDQRLLGLQIASHTVAQPFYTTWTPAGQTFTHEEAPEHGVPMPRPDMRVLRGEFQQVVSTGPICAANNVGLVVLRWDGRGWGSATQTLLGDSDGSAATVEGLRPLPGEMAATG